MKNKAITTKIIRPVKVKEEKLNILTTRDVKIPEKDKIDPEAIANTRSIDTGVFPSGRRRRKK